MLNIIENNLLKTIVNCPACGAIVASIIGPVYEIETKCPKCKRLMFYKVAIDGQITSKLKEKQ